MLLSKLLADVAEITKRPDARARSLLAINSLITDIVTNADYAEDFVEVTLDNPTPASVYGAISLAAFPLLRKISYITARDIPLARVTPRQALDARGCQLVNCYYQSGTNLIVHGQLEFSTIRMGYYQTNEYLQDNDLNTHWLITKFPALILNGAIARTFAATGDDTSATYYERLYLQLRGQVRRQDLGEGEA